MECLIGNKLHRAQFIEKRAERLLQPCPTLLGTHPAIGVFGHQASAELTGRLGLEVPVEPACDGLMCDDLCCVEFYSTPLELSSHHPDTHFYPQTLNGPFSAISARIP